MAQLIQDLMDQELSAYRRSVEGPILEALMRNGGLNQAHLTAMTRIRDGIQSCPSIDQFIDEWQDVPELPRIGKLSIAYLILKAERETGLAGARLEKHDPSLPPMINNAANILRGLQGSWLAEVAARVNPDARRRDIEAAFRGVAFVTFNYDRCIEQYLLMRFISTVGRSVADAKAALSRIPILHVYGSLGAAVPYGGPDTFIHAATKDLRTYTEEVHSDHGEAIRDIIASADKIVFLGCAYHRQNMSALFSESDQIRGAVWGTTYLMRPREIAKAKGMIPTDSQALEGVVCRDLLDRNREPIFED
jgi:hypothetical protein